MFPSTKKAGTALTVPALPFRQGASISGLRGPMVEAAIRLTGCSDNGVG